VPNVEDAHLLPAHFVIKFVRVTRECQLADSGLVALFLREAPY